MNKVKLFTPLYTITRALAKPRVKNTNIFYNARRVAIGELAPVIAEPRHFAEFGVVKTCCVTL